MGRKKGNRPDTWGPDLVLDFLRYNEEGTSISDWLRELAATCQIEPNVLRRDISEWQKVVPGFNQSYREAMNFRTRRRRGGGRLTSADFEDEAARVAFGEALIELGGNVAAAARRVGFDVATTYQRLRRGAEDRDDGLIEIHEIALQEISDEMHGHFVGAVREASETGQVGVVVNGAARFLESSNPRWGRRQEVVLKGRVDHVHGIDPKALEAAAEDLNAWFEEVRGARATSRRQDALPPGDPGVVIDLEPVRQAEEVPR